MTTPAESLPGPGPDGRYSFRGQEDPGAKEAMLNSTLFGGAEASKAPEAAKVASPDQAHDVGDSALSTAVEVVDDFPFDPTSGDSVDNGRMLTPENAILAPDTPETQGSDVWQQPPTTVAEQGQPGQGLVGAMGNPRSGGGA